MLFYLTPESHYIRDAVLSVTSVGGNTVGEYGRDKSFPRAAAGFASPPPKPTHLPPILYFAL